MIDEKELLKRIEDCEAKIELSIQGCNKLVLIEVSTLTNIVSKLCKESTDNLGNES